MFATTSIYSQTGFQRVAGTTWRPGGVTLTRHALALCDFPPNACLLDVGCGTGETVQILYEAGFFPLGIDLHPCFIKSMLHQHHFPCLLQADAHAIPIKNDVLDGIVCQCMLSLCSLPQDVLRHFSRIMKPEGRLLLTDIFVQHTLTDCTSPASQSFSRNELQTPEVVANLLTQAGFRIHSFEDHTASLRELAARLVWSGIPRQELYQWLGSRMASCAQTHTIPKSTHACDILNKEEKRPVPYGYGLWIAEKL